MRDPHNEALFGSDELYINDSYSRLSRFVFDVLESSS